IHLLTPSGTGTGTIQYQVIPSNSVYPRTDTIRAGGLAFEVTQQEAVASYDANISHSSFPVSGGSGTLTVTSNVTNGVWTLQSPSWINIGSAFSGPRNLTFTVAANPGIGSRTGNLVVADQTIQITQMGTGGELHEELATSPSQGNGWVRSSWLGSTYIPQ